MAAKNTVNQFRCQKKQRQSKQIEMLEAELEAKTKKPKENGRLLEGLPYEEEAKKEMEEVGGIIYPNGYSGIDIDSKLKKALEREEFALYDHIANKLYDGNAGLSNRFGLKIIP
jgi:hypothetical protein